VTAATYAGLPEKNGIVVEEKWCSIQLRSSPTISLEILNAQLSTTSARRAVTRFPTKNLQGGHQMRLYFPPVDRSYHAGARILQIHDQMHSGIQVCIIRDVRERHR
jgi:hypothetical protein